MSRGSITQRGSSFLLKWELSKDPVKNVARDTRRLKLKRIKKHKSN